MLQTERMLLRLAVTSDLPEVHALHAHPEVDRYNTLGIPENVSVTENILNAWLKLHQLAEPTQYTFALVHQPSQQFLGLLALVLGTPKYKRGEVWYKLLPSCWGQGYATEALRAVIGFGFGQLGLHRIEAGCAVANIGSVRVLEKVGMKKEGYFRQVLPLKSGWSDCYEYAILETDPRP